MHASAWVQAFCGDVHLGMSGNVNVTAGPIGRHACASVSVGQKGCAMVYSYSCSRGAFVGASVDGTVTHTRSNANLAFYGRPLTAKDLLLGGCVDAPPAARALYRALNSMHNSFAYSQLATHGMQLQHAAAAGAALRLPLDATYSVDDFDAMKASNAAASAAPQALPPQRDLLSITELPSSMHGAALAAPLLGGSAAEAFASAPPESDAASPRAVERRSQDGGSVSDDDRLAGLPDSSADAASEMSDELPYSLFDD